MSLTLRTTVFCLATAYGLAACPAAHADKISYHFWLAEGNRVKPLIHRDGDDGILRLSNTNGVLPASITTKPAQIGTNVFALDFPLPRGGETIPNVGLNLTLTDTTSSGVKKTETLHLGYFSGKLAWAGSDLDFHSYGRRTATFGSNEFKVDFASENVHTAPWFFPHAHLEFTVTDPASGPTTASTTPEPSGLVLACLGLFPLGLFVRWRKN
jgi:hypothetical protein